MLEQNLEVSLSTGQICYIVSRHISHCYALTFLIFELEQLIIREITSCDTKKATDVFKSLLISNTDMDMFWFDQFISWIRENF